MIIAIDFDYTIAENGYPDITKATLIKDAKEVINKLYDEGHTILIWTCRSSYKDAIQNCVEFLDKHEIKYHQINREAPLTVFKWKHVPDYMWSPKIDADLYIDDKQVGGLPSWKQIYKIINKEK